MIRKRSAYSHIYGIFVDRPFPFSPETGSIENLVLEPYTNFSQPPVDPPTPPSASSPMEIGDSSPPGAAHTPAASVPVESDDELDLIGTPSPRDKSPRRSHSASAHEMIEPKQPTKASSLPPQEDSDHPINITPTPKSDTEGGGDSDDASGELADGEEDDEEESVRVAHSLNEEMVAAVDTEKEAGNLEGDALSATPGTPELKTEDAELPAVSEAPPSNETSLPLPVTSVPPAPSETAMEVDQAEDTLHQEPQTVPPQVEPPRAAAPSMFELKVEVPTPAQLAPPSATDAPSPVNPTPKVEPVEIPLSPTSQRPPTETVDPSVFLSTEHLSTEQKAPDSRYQFTQNYTLPPLKSLPAEFQRKGKPSKLQRKKEKEREKADRQDMRKDKDEFIPLGANRLAIVCKVNPLLKKMSRANKCLSSRDWGVGPNLSCSTLTETHCRSGCPR